MGEGAQHQSCEFLREFFPIFRAVIGHFCNLLDGSEDGVLFPYN
jgi:hypothetical protein